MDKLKTLFNILFIISEDLVSSGTSSSIILSFSEYISTPSLFSLLFFEEEEEEEDEDDDETEFSSLIASFISSSILFKVLVELRILSSFFLVFAI